MASVANHNSMTSLLALLQLILFITYSSSEAASTGSPSSKSPALLRSSVMHPAFESAGKTAGLKIWRIEVNIVQLKILYNTYKFRLLLLFSFFIHIYIYVSIFHFLFSYIVSSLCLSDVNSKTFYYILK